MKREKFQKAKEIIRQIEQSEKAIQRLYTQLENADKAIKEGKGNELDFIDFCIPTRLVRKILGPVLECEQKETKRLEEKLTKL